MVLEKQTFVGKKVVQNLVKVEDFNCNVKRKRLKYKISLRKPNKQCHHSLETTMSLGLVSYVFY